MHTILNSPKAYYLSARNLGLRPVLLESEIKDGMIYGFTDNYIKTKMKYEETLVNKVVDVRLLRIADDGCVEGRVEY